MHLGELGIALLQFQKPVVDLSQLWVVGCTRAARVLNARHRQARKLLGLVKLALVPQQRTQVEARDRHVKMTLAKCADALLQRFSEQGCALPHRLGARRAIGGEVDETGHGTGCELLLVGLVDLASDLAHTLAVQQVALPMKRRG